MRRRITRLLTAALLVPPAFVAVQPAFGQDDAPRELLRGNGAVLQGLDKVTATVTTFTAPLDTVVRFGTLDITVRTCRKTPPTEPPEMMAFLEVDETNPNTDAARLYSGWMFASSPALAALEHPVYDVWVIDCMNAGGAPDNSPDAAPDAASDEDTTEN